MTPAKTPARHATTRAPQASTPRMMRLGRGLAAVGLVIAGYGMSAASCTTTRIDTGEGGGTTGPNQPGPGELCFSFDEDSATEVDPALVKVRFEPTTIFLAPGQTKKAKVIVDPDFCDPFDVLFDGTNPDVAATPETMELQYAVPEVEVTLTGNEIGTTEITVSLPTQNPDITATATLTVDVMSPELAECDATDGTSATLDPGTTVGIDSGSLAGASIHLPENADRPNENGFQWSVQPFDVQIACGEKTVAPGYEALGPAVRFGPTDKVFPRDMPLAIPLNPARMPETARLRHLHVAYQSPDFREPRVFPITNPQLHKDDDGHWYLAFEADRLGTFQAVVKPDAGTVVRKRRITHRAIIGVSMGGAGTQQFGMRHHHLFDVIAPLGGPVDWTWLIHHLERNHLGGFRPIAPGTQLADIPTTRAPCQSDADCEADEQCLGVTTSGGDGACTFTERADEAYEHTSAFNAWWYEFPGQGHGGSFDREEYTQIFRDLTLMFGNPMGYNPDALNLPAGVDPNHPSQVGTLGDGKDCSVYIDPYDGAGDLAEELWQQCPSNRCQFVQTLQNYYDDEYNPDGTFPVITFCDGSPQQPDRTPYANWWSDVGNTFPMEVGLAVDYNANGVRDEMEPVIRSGHEHWDDFGADGLPNEQEPGYDAASNRDPAGDDYNPRFNPTGLERDMRWQEGEPYLDHGLDGVDGTASSPFDHGEDDGEFTVAPGLQYFWDVDAHSMVRQWQSIASTPMDDEALARMDVWTDGGIRDLFNFGVAAEHFLGGFVARGRSAAYYSDVTKLPGLSEEQPDAFRVIWEDVPGAINLRYGIPDLTEMDIENGSGQHVGTVPELARRIFSALYFIDSRWPDAPRALVEPSPDNPAENVDPCEITSTCQFQFTSSDGRTGPVAITLPPGYGHADRQDVRYPVVYMLHGYGMTPEDLSAAIAFLANLMNQPSSSIASRLGKAIVVYVDGRCRIGDENEAECIRGSFFADSIRPDGVQMDKWWLELIDHIDENFRTMPETQVDWVE